MIKKIYIAGPLFNKHEQMYLEDIAKELEGNGYDCFLPHRDQTGIDESELKNNYDKNLPQILEMYSGIEIRRLFDGVEGTNSSIDMRGFGEASKSNVLILVNGIRLNEIDMSNISFSNIPLTSIDRIEIVRGGSSATLYGSGAVGGSINVVTKNDITQNNVGFSYGSYNTQKLNVNTGTKIDNNSSISFCLLYTSPSPRDVEESRMPSSA